jgi:hypothetical protein
VEFLEGALVLVTMHLPNQVNREGWTSLYTRTGDELTEYVAPTEPSLPSATAKIGTSAGRDFKSIRKKFALHLLSFICIRDFRARLHDHAMVTQPALSESEECSRY